MTNNYWLKQNKVPHLGDLGGKKELLQEIQ